MRRRISAGASAMCAVLSFTPLAHADEPLPLPERAIVESANAKFEAEQEPGTSASSGAVTVYEKTGGKRGKKLWTLGQWYRNVSLADDGAHLVAGDDGLGLIVKRDVEKDPVLLRFFERGREVRAVRLSELVPRSKLKETASHYRWGQCIGIEASTGRYRVDTVDGRTLRFDVKTGRPE